LFVGRGPIPSKNHLKKKNGQKIPLGTKQDAARFTGKKIGILKETNYVDS